MISVVEKIIALQIYVACPRQKIKRIPLITQPLSCQFLVSFAAAQPFQNLLKMFAFENIFTSSISCHLVPKEELSKINVHEGHTVNSQPGPVSRT